MDEATQEIIEEIKEIDSGFDKTQSILLLIAKELREINTNLSEKNNPSN